MQLHTLMLGDPPPPPVNNEDSLYILENAVISFTFLHESGQVRERSY